MSQADNKSAERKSAIKLVLIHYLKEFEYAPPAYHSFYDYELAAETLYNVAIHCGDVEAAIEDMSQHIIDFGETDITAIRALYVEFPALNTLPVSVAERVPAYCSEVLLEDYLPQENEASNVYEMTN